MFRAAQAAAAGLVKEETKKQIIDGKWAERAFVRWQHSACQCLQNPPGILIGSSMNL